LAQTGMSFGAVALPIILSQSLWFSEGVVAPRQALPSQTTAQSRCRIDTSKAAHVGQRIVSDGIQFGRISGAVLVHDTILAVVDGSVPAVFFLTPTGKAVGSVGRRGSGPGEVVSIDGISNLSDTIFVFDSFARRYLAFAFPARLVREGTLPPSSQPYRTIAVVPGGQFLIAAHINSRPRGRTGPEMWYDSLELRLVDATGAIQSRVARVPDLVRQIDVQSSFNVLPGPFAQRPDIIVSGSRVVIGEGNAVIRQIGWSDRSSTVIRAPWQRVRISSRDADAWKAKLLAELPQPAAGRAMLNAATVPDSMPAHGRLTVDSRGTLWVQEYRPSYYVGSSRVNVIDSRGVTIGQTALGSGSTLLAASPSLVAALHKDSYNVESVQLFRIECGLGRE
jgi:hypothetical protein